MSKLLRGVVAGYGAKKSGLRLFRHGDYIHYFVVAAGRHSNIPMTVRRHMHMRVQAGVTAPLFPSVPAFLIS